MDVPLENLIRLARETVTRATLSDPGLVAAYLTGSLRGKDPFPGDVTDIDLVYVHEGEPKVHREIIPLSPEFHLDIVHNPRRLYDRPKELRIHPWLGPELYDPLPLYVTRHFLEFVQAAVRDRYYEPANVQARSRHLSDEARQNMPSLQSRQDHGAKQVLEYLEAVNLAANSVALLAGDPLSERRFLLQFPVRARAAGQPALIGSLFNLLGVNQINTNSLAGFLPDWEKAFIEAAGLPDVDRRVAPARLGYYKLAFEAMLKSEFPQAILWPLMMTWTLAMTVLPSAQEVRWRSACALLGFDEGSFGERLDELNHLLDRLEAMQRNLTD